ncbi:MAG TPA: protein kinase [Verrucomicrobiales bacterium]|nr:protein kinase [Verrucomicrobiales bacterium]
MNNEEEIFDAASLLVAGERAVFLDRACAGRSALRERVEALLRSHDATGFMENRTATAGLSPASSAAQTGERIGRYHLLEQIGEGGFGIVWMAEQLEPVTRRVALKIIKAGMDSTEVIARFEAERQALAMMDHPNIARVFDAGATDQGRPYFVMELVNGIPITKFCDEQEFTIRQRLKLFEDVCSAINHAHQKGVIHRDLKPSNVMVTLDADPPVVKVIDFGIAKATQGRLTDRTFFTRFEQFVGTPAYMSPEQVAMSGLDLDTRSDIYGLGILLYELLTGTPPFNPKTLVSSGYEEMRRIIREVEPPRPSTRLGTAVAKDQSHLAKARHIHPDKLRRLVEPDLDWIVMKAIEKDRARRYETANSLATDISRYLQCQPVLARPPGRGYLLSRFIRRHKFGFTAGMAISLSLIGGIAGTIWALVGEREAREAAETHKNRAEGESARAMAQVREASRSDTATAGQRFAEGKWQEGVAYLGRAIRYDPANQQSQRALWLALRHGERDAGRLPVHVLKHGSRVYCANFSPDGTRVVTISANKTVRVWNTATGQLMIPPLQHKARILAAKFSPDGTRLITASQDNPHTLSRNTGKPPGAAGSNSLAFVNELTLHAWDLATGQRIGLPVPLEGVFDGADLSPDGTRVITTSLDLAARLWDATTGKLTGTLFHYPSDIWNVRFSPDGTRIITAHLDKTERIWDATNGQSAGAIFKDASFAGHRASLGPDGTCAASASQDDTARLWDTSTGKAIGTALQHKGSVWHVDFSPDGTRFVTASSDETARVWSAVTGQPLGPPLKHEAEVNQASFSPDGTLIVTASEDHTARIWDVTAGRPTGVPLKHETGIYDADFSDDGTRVVGRSAYQPMMWNAATGQPFSFPFKHDDGPLPAIFNASGSRFAATGANNTIQVWDVDLARPTGVPLQLEGRPSAPVFSPDGTRLLTCAGRISRVWDTATGQPIGAPMEHKEGITGARFSRDGSRIVTTTWGNAARVWDAAAGQPIGVPLQHKQRVLSAEFNPQCTRVVTGSEDYTAQVWDASSGRAEGLPLAHEHWVRGAAFSPDGTRIVTECSKSARIWNATTSQQIGAPLKHETSLMSAFFSPDGLYVITASRDRTVRMWDAATCQPIGPPLKHGYDVYTGKFSQDGGRIVSRAECGGAWLWDAITTDHIDPGIAENLAAFSAGARLDPLLGSLEPLSADERLALWQKLEPALRSLPDWRFVAGQQFRSDPTALVSPRMTLTIRQAASILIETDAPIYIQKALEIDPGHPVLPLAFARIEAEKTTAHPSGPVRAAWLINYGMKRLPTETSAADLRLAARMVGRVAKTLPDQKTVAVALLDRAEKLEPGDTATQALRKSLQQVK